MGAGKMGVGEMGVGEMGLTHMVNCMMSLFTVPLASLNITALWPTALHCLSIKISSRKARRKCNVPSNIDILMDTFWTTDISLLDVAH